MRPAGPDLAALRTLRDLWGEEAFVLIGASALALRVDVWWRTTQDVDLAVAALPRAIDDALGGLPGWTRDPRLPHRWSAPGGARLDVVPAARELLTAGAVEWPETGTRMALAGLDLAFSHGESLELEPGLRVRVPPAEVIAVLKMISFLDRPADRRRDLTDLALLLEELVPPSADERFGEDVVKASVDYEDVSAWRLGRRLAALEGEVVAETVRRFVQRLRDDDVAQAWMLRDAPLSWREAPEILLARLSALEAGLRAG